MNILEHIHGGNLREASEKFGLERDRITDFSANINPLGPSPGVYKSIRENLDQILHYPDPQAKALKTTLAQYLELSTENIVLGNGAVELIYLLAKVLKPKRVLIPAPTFNEYELAVTTNGGQVVDLFLKKEEDYNYNVQEILKKLPEVDLLILCNPNNPTGHLIKKEDIVTILSAAKKENVFVMIDEAFMDFVEQAEDYSVISELDKWDNLFILYSLTKFFAIPGLRLGAGLANRELIKKMEHMKDPWNVNCFAQLAGIVSLQDLNFIDNTKAFMNAEKRFLYQGLCDIPSIRPYLPSANYIFVDISEFEYGSSELYQVLAKKGILVRDCSSYKQLGQNYIRVAVKNRADNTLLLQKLREIK